MNHKHANAIDAARSASDSLLASGLSPEQQQWVVDMMNAAQDLNKLYWDLLYPRTLARLVWEAIPCERAQAESAAAHIIANAGGTR